MSPSCNSNDRAAIGENAVYPGHPVTIALVIVRTHANFEFANTDKEKHGWPHAVGCSAVPGAGGNVHYAMDLLQGWARGEAFDNLVKEADRVWHDCDGQAEGGGGFAKDNEQRQRFITRWRDGQDQAERFKPLLVEALKTWPRS